MRRQNLSLSATLLLVTILAATATAQSPLPPSTPQPDPAPQRTVPQSSAPQTAVQTPPPPAAGSTVLQAGTQLVVVDVVVEDRNGNPVRGLKAEDFELLEDKKPQAVRNFEAHTTQAAAARGPELPKMPPGTFTDYTPMPPSGTLNILLLDALNTPMKDQSFVRQQLQEYVKHADPGTRIAIFGLANRLLLLQGFTSDPETLKDVVNHKLIPRGSALLDDPVSGEDVAQPSDNIDSSAPGMAELAANMQQFEAQMSAMQTQLRTQYTLDAFNTLAHYLAAFPGRKNLIWFSGAFPINILPDPTIENPFAVMNLDEQEYRETTNLLARAQVAVYPVDARGLMTMPMYSASQSGAKFARNPQSFGAAVNKFGNSQAAEHTTMNMLAEDTGGHAYYNTNDLASAVSKAVHAGADYYSLTYSPTNRKHDGGYRQIRVNLTPAKAPNLQLAYRHGYYDDDAGRHAKDPSKAETSATTSTTADASQRSGLGYARAAMARGGPTPEDILFKVRVLPANTEKETVVAEGNQLDPLTPSKGPFHRFAIDFVALPNEITMTLQPDGRRSGQVQFIAYVYDRDGRLLNTMGRQFSMELKPNTYKAFLQNALQCHLEISVPDRVETYLRVAVQDMPTNRFGVVEIPTSTVSRLPPAVYAKAPPATPSTSPTPATTPSTTPAVTRPPLH